MEHITYRTLQPEELGQFTTIDRSERIDGQYALVHGTLEMQAFHLDVNGWHETEVVSYVARLHKTLACGGAVFGAWDRETLAGVASLDITPIRGNPELLKLDLLHISAPYRHQGIGTRLTSMVAERARALGATGLYISATPTRNTVDAYLRMGASLLAAPDPDLLAEEPEDIHLVLPISSRRGSTNMERLSHKV